MWPYVGMKGRSVAGCTRKSMSDAPSTLEEGEIHDILRNDRRRAVLEFLSEHDGRATIRELSEYIATLESGENPPPRNIRQSVYVSLHQTHLPKLDGLGVVDYDTDSKQVELHSRASYVRSYMGQNGGGNTVPLLYVLIGALGVALSLITATGNSTLGSGLWLAPLFVIVLLLGGYQLWRRLNR